MGIECGKRVVLLISGGILKLKENEKVCFKFEFLVMSKGFVLFFIGNFDIYVLELFD